MNLYRCLTRLAPSTHSCRKISPLLSKTASRGLASSSKDQLSKLFEYTSGRWLYNDALRRAERKRIFNVAELKRLAAESVKQTEADIVRFEKLAEGGFNRAFLVTVRDGNQLVARIPYPITEPKQLAVASEVATMNFLRLHGIPVPEVYGYSTTSDNPAGTEYVFMEYVRGQNLGDIWFDLPEKARIDMVTKLVELESRLFALQFPANGSIYHSQDLQAEADKVDLPSIDSTHGSFCIGPDTTYKLWHGKRSSLLIDRGPCRDPIAALEAGAKKEIVYLKKFGRPLHPFERVRREVYNYEKQSHLDHVNNLDEYLQITPYLIPIPRDGFDLTRPTIRHPDLQPSNIFVSSNLDITGVIDWQHCKILPLFLQCGIPQSFQNYGDDVSESIQLPKLPENMADLDEQQQSKELELLRKRQIHHFYITKTESLNPLHARPLAENFSVLRRKLFDHASEPWEGDNVTLKADLIELTQNWPGIIASQSPKSATHAACPLEYTEREVAECLRLNSAQIEADETLQTCRDIIGFGAEGWVPAEYYEEVKERERVFREMSLESAESAEERQIAMENWPFADFDEGEYM